MAIVHTDMIGSKNKDGTWKVVVIAGKKQYTHESMSDEKYRELLEWFATHQK